MRGVAGSRRCLGQEGGERRGWGRAGRNGAGRGWRVAVHTQLLYYPWGASPWSMAPLASQTHVGEGTGVVEPRHDTPQAAKMPYRAVGVRGPRGAPRGDSDEALIRYSETLTLRNLKELEATNPALQFHPIKVICLSADDAPGCRLD
ncbi:hypothetical protein E2C01_022076 [Portunus trituberculatus]|uniref:Uncharacterized protein n=1 Tax=Portunus trituberculatus TaxID=210409 RepID=A0A5B7E6P1_PORTR|nr:hypothetical protein [Portunus trituberculatus]